MRYSLYLIACLIAESVAIPAAFILPLFARSGWLPKGLAWFQTPDNGLHGDRGWEEEHWQWRHRLPDLASLYITYAGWLLRNRAYGFKWSVLAAPIEEPKAYTYRGNLAIKNRDNAKAGWFFCRMGDYWQWKAVWKIPGTRLCAMLNFGWQLDNYLSDPALVNIRPRALFMFSPRISAFRPASQP